MNPLILKGKIRVSSDNGILSDVENTVTTLFEDYVAAGTLDHFFVGSYPVELGKTFIASAMPSGSTNVSFTKYPQQLFTVYLLNLTDAERKALKKSSHLLPVYDGSFQIDDSKVVGYANAYVVGSANKRGYVQPLDSDFLINHRRHGLMFKWDADVVSGTFNAIAVGMNVMNNRYAGIALFMGLESNNQARGETSPSGYFIRPGVKNSDGSLVLTTDNEILLGDVGATQKARKVLNLKTGVITPIENTDPRYDFPLYDSRFAQACYGDYLIRCGGGTVYRVNLNTKAQTQIGSGQGFFIHDGYLYTKYSTTTFRAYNLDTFSYTSSKDLTIANMDFPAEFLASVSNHNLRVSNIGDKFLVSLIRTHTSSDIASFSEEQKTIVCSDITNVAGSIVDMVPNVNTNMGVEIDGEYYYFNNFIPNPFIYNQYFAYPDAGGSSKMFYMNGCKMCKSGMYGNLFSFHTYEEDQQIPAGQALKLEYYYTFEQ